MAPTKVKSNGIGAYLDVYLEEINLRRIDCDEDPVQLADVASEKDKSAIGRYLRQKGWPTVESWRERVKEWVADDWTAGNGLLRLRDFQGWHQRRVLKMAAPASTGSDW